MIFTAKLFKELTTRELYEILKSRSQVFMLEQNIHCQDMDDMDYDSLHCFFEEGGRVTAYLRAYYENEDKATVRIGRVLTVTHGIGLGKRLMEESLSVIKEKMNCHRIVMDAQKYAIGFYEKFGFETVSEEFLEEGIVHVVMELWL